MITTISLVTIHPHTKLRFVFLVMRTFRFYSLGNFQIGTTILLTIVPLLYVTSPRLTYFIAGSFHLWIPFTHFVHPQHRHPLATAILFSVFMSFVCSFALFFGFHI